MPLASRDELNTALDSAFKQAEIVRTRAYHALADAEAATSFKAHSLFGAIADDLLAKLNQLAERIVLLTATLTAYAA